jgi:hypothetical protein
MHVLSFSSDYLLLRVEQQSWINLLCGERYEVLLFFLFIKVFVSFGTIIKVLPAQINTLRVFVSLFKMFQFHR